MTAEAGFNSFINPIWDKAGSHIVNMAESLNGLLRKRI